MDSTRNEIKQLIKYIRNLGIEVNLNTKARGHQGFFLKNRIDISKNTPLEKIVQVLLHEFAHYIHYGIEPDVNKTKGNLSVIFDTNEDIFDELIEVTNFVDENSRFIMLKKHKELVKKQILEQEKIIKNEYPKFQRSKKFKEFDRFIRFSKAKYLLKYDKFRYITPFLRKSEYYSISSMENDFKMPSSFYAYIRLKAYQRKQARISSKINRLKKYYSLPTELFARFVEGYYLDKDYLQEVAPKSLKAFELAMEKGYYSNLSEILTMVLK